MEIRVTDMETEEVVFLGDADLFLEENEYDEEIEFILNKVERMNVGEGEKLYGNFTDTFFVEKLENYI